MARKSKNMKFGIEEMKKFQFVIFFIEFFLTLLEHYLKLLMVINMFV
jgi:hypothetical protein